MVNSIRNPFRYVSLCVAAMLSVNQANAGTGYIDAAGNWHFSMVLVQPPAPATPIDKAR